MNEIIEYIAQDSIETAEPLVLFPDQGRVIPELLKQNITKYKDHIISLWRLIAEDWIIKELKEINGV